MIWPSVQPQKFTLVKFKVNTYESSFSTGDRTRAFLKVQDGCDYKCSYCTIPLARGISRSDTVENVVAKAKEIAQEDIKEIVLTGVNIGDFGKGEFGLKRHKDTFLDLVTALDEVEGLIVLGFLLLSQIF